MCFLWYFQEHNQTPENIFQNFFWNATKHLKIFSFPKNSISGKYLFSGKYFTWTKHSLSFSVYPWLVVGCSLLFTTFFSLFFLLSVSCYYLTLCSSPFSSMATSPFYSGLIQWNFSLLPLGLHQLFLVCCEYFFRTAHQLIGYPTTTITQYVFATPLLISWQNFILFVLVVYLYLWVQMDKD